MQSPPPPASVRGRPFHGPAREADERSIGQRIAQAAQGEAVEHPAGLPIDPAAVPTLAAVRLSEVREKERNGLESRISRLPNPSFASS